MCKINESPWQLQLDARCFIYFSLCLSYEGSGMVVSSAFNPKIRTFEETHSGEICLWRPSGVSVVFLCTL